MNPTQALSDVEIDELDEFLLSDDTPDNCMDLSMLDGFLASIVLNPDFILPSEYLPWIWDIEEGEAPPSFNSIDQANHIMGLLMRYYNGVLDAIANNNFSPLFYILEQDDDSQFYDAESWSEGFMRGVSLYNKHWMEILVHHPDLIAPMVLLGTESGWEALDKMEDSATASREAYESIAEAVAQLFIHFAGLRSTEMASRQVQTIGIRMESEAPVTIEDNDACPCGSGKRFKHCCGVPPTVH
jgi:uncharacterized protein